jgi:hypothetical protein
MSNLRPFILASLLSTVAKLESPFVGHIALNSTVNGFYVAQRTNLNQKH